MTYDELNEGQRLELKQRILLERNDARGEGTSCGELADAGNLVSDEDARDWAEGMEFSEDDFSRPSTPTFTTVERIPQWATCYLVNSDGSGLEPDDRKLVDDYVARLLSRGLRLVGPIDGTENEFCAHPAFGLSCGTVDFAAEELRDDDE